MDQDRIEMTGRSLMKWIVLVLLVVLGIGLYLYFAPTTRPAVPPTVQEYAP
jgi:hypothetical protein